MAKKQPRKFSQYGKKKPRNFSQEKFKWQKKQPNKKIFKSKKETRKFSQYGKKKT
jgi:hypothetical protein